MEEIKASLMNLSIPGDCWEVLDNCVAMPVATIFKVAFINEAQECYEDVNGRGICNSFITKGYVRRVEDSTVATLNWKVYSLEQEVNRLLKDKGEPPMYTPYEA